MKRIFTISTICVLLSIISADVNAQIIKGETFLGLNASKIHGDNLYNGYKRFGLHAGVGAIVPIYQKDNFSIDFALELAFNQRGSHQDSIMNGYIKTATDSTHITGEYNLYMNYLEVPILFYFSDKDMYSLGLGFSYGRLVGLKEYEHGKRTDVNLSYNGPDKYNLDDFCVLVDAKVRIYERLKLGIRFQYSLTPIRSRYFKNLDNNYVPDANGNLVWTQHNNSITARLIYVFNEDRTKYLDDTYEFRGDNPRIHQKAIDRKIKKLKRKQAREEKKKK